MKPNVGILAYGSLIADPGKEIASATVETMEGITTPFKVEFARSSKERAGAPTLVPVEDHGAPVRAKVFVLSISETEATNRLYRREINNVGSGHCYQVRKNPTQNTVIIKRLNNFASLNVVLYTEIGPDIQGTSAKKLAELAIKSARKLDDRRDGISYLIDAKENGIKTPLSGEYEEEIKRQMHATDLHEALRKARMG